jgi:hypothetical protein
MIKATFPVRFCASLCTFFLLMHSTTRAAEKSDAIELERMTVTDSPPGSIPFGYHWYYNRLTSSILIAPVIPPVALREEIISQTVVDHRGKPTRTDGYWKINPPDVIALKYGGQILAIDGRDVTTMSNRELKKLCNDGPAGETVRLIIRGCGPELHLFREITVRRISDRKRDRLIAEVAGDTELKPARSLAELPAMPEPR